MFSGQGNDKLCSYSITADMVKSKLCKLKMNQAPGVDSVGTRMLIEMSEEISHTVADIFSTGECSARLEVSKKYVSAVFKKGSKTSLLITGPSVLQII